MRTVTPRAKFTIEANIVPTGQTTGRLLTPKMTMNTDLDVSEADVATMFLNMAKFHMERSGSEAELAKQFLGFMKYYSLKNPK